jgi:hypothetical protein
MSFFRYAEINFSHVHLVYVCNIKLKWAPAFLRCIADGDPDGAEKLLQKCPELAVLARGTVTTVSGYTYENITAIQLAYLMDDDDMCNRMLPYLEKLSEEMRKDAVEQLAKKMAEVEQQASTFKPYDFSELVKAITADPILKDTSPETKKALEQFKEDLTLGVIKCGKSFIKEHLQEGYKVYEQNFDPWNIRQLRWYLIHIIGHLQTRVENVLSRPVARA